MVYTFTLWYDTIRLRSRSRKIRQCRKDKYAEAAARAMRQEVDSVARTNMPKLSQGQMVYIMVYILHYGVHFTLWYTFLHYGVHLTLWYTFYVVVYIAHFTLWYTFHHGIHLPYYSIDYGIHYGIYYGNVKHFRL